MDQKYKAMRAVSLTQNNLMHLIAEFPDELKLLINQLFVQLQTTLKEF
jgi:hypothetical protein